MVLEKNDILIAGAFEALENVSPWVTAVLGRVLVCGRGAGVCMRMWAEVRGGHLHLCMWCG